MKRLRPILALAGVLAARDASARPSAPEILCATYPTIPICASTPRCSTCHTVDNVDPQKPDWNAYGKDLGKLLDDNLDAASFNAAFPGALEAVATLDSDQDGFENADELIAGSQPGEAASVPGDLECPDDPWSLDYPLCAYDPRLVFQKIHRDFCGRSPTYEAYASFVALSDAERKVALHEALDQCLDSEFWLSKDGVVWQLAHKKVRPVGALKAGADTGFLPLADYYDDYNLFVWSQIDDHDCRSVLVADFFVKRTDAPTHYDVTDATDLSGCGNQCNEAVVKDRRAGLMTTRWMLLYFIMFTPLQRALAAQAYRSYLGYDIARMEGLAPVDGEPKNYDGTGVDAPACAQCHSTLDPLTYPFRNYNGLTGGLRAQYVPTRLETFFESKFPGISATPEPGYLLGQPVADLVEWADVAANSEAFAKATVLEYWNLLMGRPPEGAESDELSALSTDLMGKNAYSVERMLHDFIETKSYGAP